MIKIGVVVDPHLVERACRCRKDNFFETALGKLDYIASENDYVLIAGDLCHIHNNSTLFFNTLFTLMNKHKGKFHGILGNHDMFSRNLSALNRTTVGSLFYTGAYEVHLKPFKLAGITFVPAMVNTDVDNIPVDTENSNILIAHKFFDQKFSPDESLFAEDIRALNYDTVFLGHDHKPYPTEYIGNSTVIRMGSLTRIDTQEYNKDREIKYYQIETDGESGKFDCFERVIPYKPLSEVYTEEAFNKMHHRDSGSSIVSFLQIGDALAKLTKQQDGAISLDRTLRRLNTPDQSIDNIKWRHESEGVTYT